MATVKEVLLNARGDVTDARHALAELQADLRAIPNTKTTEFKLRQDRVDSQLKSFQRKLREIDRTKVSPEVSVEIGKALLDLETLNDRVRALPKTTRMTVEVRKGVDRDLHDIEGGILAVEKGLGAVLPKTRTFGQAMGGVTQAVKSTTPVLNGLTIILGTKLIPGLIALVGAAGGAATAVGGLAISFVAALGPIAALAAAVGTRLSKVMEAKKAQDAAAQEAAEASAGGTTLAAQAADKRRQSENALRDALQGRDAAERGLAEARRQAAAAIVTAQDAQESAATGLTEANRRLGEVTQDAYDAMKQAAEDATDAVLDLEQAQLGVEGAQLGVEKARQALKDFGREAGVSATRMDQLFEKFTNVDVDLGDVAKDLLAGVDGAQGGGAESKQIRAKELILALRQAKLDEKKATDTLGDSEDDLGRKRRENAKFQKQGIAAYAPLIQAQQAQRDATKQLADATKESNRLTKLGVKGAPSVIAATDAMRDAEERLHEQRIQTNRVRNDSGATAAQKKAATLTAQLTDNERDYLGALQDTQKFLTGAFKGATDEVIGGLSDALKLLPALFGPLQDEFDALGGSVRKALGQLGLSLLTSVRPMERVTKGAGVLVEQLGGRGLGHAISIVANLASAVMPILEEVVTDAANALEGLATQMNTPQGRAGFANIIAQLVPVLKAVVKFAIQLGAALVEAFVAVAPYAEDLVNFITDGVKQFRRWVKSAKGQKEIQRFFMDTIPLVKSIIKFIVRLGVMFLRAFQAFSPVLKPTIDALTFVVDVVSFLIGLFGKLPQPIRTALGGLILFSKIGSIFKLIAGGAGRFLAILGKFGGGAISRIAQPFIRLFGTIGSKLGGLPGQLAALGGRAMAALGTALSRAGGAVGRAAGGVGRSVLGALRTSLRAVYSVGKWLLTRFFNGLRNFGNIALRAGRFVWDKVWSGLKTAATAIFNAGRWVVTHLITGLRNSATRIYNLGKSLLSGLIKGFTTVTGAVWNAIKGLANKIVDAVKSVLHIRSPSKVMYGLGQYMLQGLIKGFTDGDVKGFIKKELGGFAKLGAQLALDVNPFIPGPAKGLLKEALSHLPGLAKGGLTTGPTFAQIGEGRHQEAVLPLSRSVMRQLARALAAQMRFPAPAALAGAGPSGAGATVQPRMVIEHQDVHLPAAPGHAQMGDPRHAAIEFSREMARRGTGVPL